MNRYMKNLLLILGSFLVIGLNACLDEEEPEFDVIGGVGTISVIEASNDNPAEGEQVQVSMTYFSEHVAAEEIRLNATVGSDAKALVSSQNITDFDTQDSYVATFNYTIPAGSSGESIVLEGEIVTVNDLVNSNSTTVTVQ